MNNQYPPEWDEPIDEFDPWLGTAYDAYRPNPAQRSLVAELALAYVSRDRRAINIAFDLVADALEDNQVPQLVLGLLESLHGAAVDGQGCQRAVQRLQSRLEAAQHRALRAVAAAS